MKKFECCEDCIFFKENMIIEMGWHADGCRYLEKKYYNPKDPYDNIDLFTFERDGWDNSECKYFKGWEEEK